MNKSLAWVLVGAAVVSAGIGAAVGLGLFRGGDVNPPAPSSPPAAAGTPSPAEPVPPAAPHEEPVPADAGEPHGNPGPAMESADEETAPAGVGAAEVPSPGPVALTVRGLTAEAGTYAGREVVLTGRILTLCVRGCQLTLDDGTGTIPVELVDDALANTVPLRSMGRQIEVTGVFRLTPRPHVAVERPDGWRFP